MADYFIVKLYILCTITIYYYYILYIKLEGVGCTDASELIVHASRRYQWRLLLFMIYTVCRSVIDFDKQWHTFLYIYEGCLYSKGVQKHIGYILKSSFHANFTNGSSATALAGNSIVELKSYKS